MKLSLAVLVFIKEKKVLKFILQSIFNALTITVHRCNQTKKGEIDTVNDTKLIHEIETAYSNAAGIVIQKNGTILYEKYFQGHKDSDPIHVFSVTKSITSILIGMAMDQGYLQSVEQKVLDFFPNYVTKRGEKTIQNITLKHLLTMTAPYKYKSEPYTKVYGSEDWTKAALDLLGGKGNLGDFKYSTIGAQILSGILQNATGMNVLEYASQNFFTPLGIPSPKPTEVIDKEAHIAFLKDKNVSGWIVDPTGLPAAGWGLTLCPRDMIKIGQLYLNQGVWEDKQLVSSSWVRESTGAHSSWNELLYGYLWWKLTPEENGPYGAFGDSGNVIYIHPQKQLVIAIASHFKPRARLVTALIDNYILPLF